jgi:biotin/methionine sulfoxide reductase
VSPASKRGGREPLAVHPTDAAGRGITDGDVVGVRNDRRACLAGAVLIPSSWLSQGCAGRQALVQVSRFDGPVPPGTVHRPPPGVDA